jgi:hypothetical protein
MYSPLHTKTSYSPFYKQVGFRLFVHLTLLSSKNKLKQIHVYSSPPLIKPLPPIETHLIRPLPPIETHLIRPLTPIETHLIRPLPPIETPLIRPLPPIETPLIRPLTPIETHLIRPLTPKVFRCTVIIKYF